MNSPKPGEEHGLFSARPYVLSVDHAALLPQNSADVSYLEFYLALKPASFWKRLYKWEISFTIQENQHTLKKIALIKLVLYSVPTSHFHKKFLKNTKFNNMQEGYTLFGSKIWYSHFGKLFVSIDLR